MAKHFIRMLHPHLGPKIAFEQFSEVLQSLGEPREVTDISLTLRGRTYHGFLIWYLKRFPKPESGYDLGGISVEFKFQNSAALLSKVKALLRKMSPGKVPILVTKEPPREPPGLSLNRLRHFLRTNTSSSPTSLNIESGWRELVATFYRKGVEPIEFTFLRKKSYLTALLDTFREIEKKGRAIISMDCLGRFSLGSIKHAAQSKLAQGHLRYWHYDCPVRFDIFSDLVKVRRDSNQIQVIWLEHFEDKLKVIVHLVRSDEDEKEPPIIFFVPRLRRNIAEIYKFLREELSGLSVWIDLACLDKFSLRRCRKYNPAYDDSPYC